MKNSYLFNFDLVFTKKITNLMGVQQEELEPRYIKNNFNNPKGLAKLLQQINEGQHEIIIYGNYKPVKESVLMQGKDFILLYLQNLLGEGENFLSSKNIYAYQGSDFEPLLEKLILKFNKIHSLNTNEKNNQRRFCVIDYDNERLDIATKVGCNIITVKNDLTYLKLIEKNLKESEDVYGKQFVKYLSQRDSFWMRKKGVLTIAAPVSIGIFVALLILLLARKGQIHLPYHDGLLLLIGFAAGCGPFALCFSGAYTYSTCKRSKFDLPMTSLSKLGSSILKLPNSRPKPSEEELLLQSNQINYLTSRPQRSLLISKEVDIETGIGSETNLILK